MVHIPIYLAMGILLLHGMVPHQHSDQQHQNISAPEVITAFSWLSFIEDLVGIDLGDEHLENFQTSRGFDDFGHWFLFSDQIAEVPISSPIMIRKEEHAIPRALGLGSPSWRPTLTLRGPPISIQV